MAERQLRAEGYEPIGNPVEELLKLGAEVTAFKDVLRQRAAELEDPEWINRSSLGVQDVVAVVAAYERALDRCERTLTNMLRLDLEARRVRLDEQQGELLAAVIKGVISDLGLAADPRVPATVRKHLALVAGSS